MRSSLLALSVALTVAGSAWAQTEEDEHAAHHQNPQAAQPAQAQERPAAPRAAAADLKSVEDLMARIQNTGEAAQRADLLRQHALALREQVRAMRAANAQRMAMMGGGQRKDGGADDPHAAHGADGAQDGKKPMGGGMMKMHERMERRLDGIERVLEQLIEREVVESGAR